MSDKSLYILLVMMFGIGAIVILSMSWLTPMPLADRLINTLFAAIGVAMALMMRRYITTS